MHATAAPYFAHIIENAQLVGLTSQSGRHSTHHELVVDSTYVENSTWHTLPVVQSTHVERTAIQQYSELERLLSLAIETPRHTYLALSDDEIRMFDRALIASTKLVYELKV
jgi:hypothetical protein